MTFDDISYFHVCALAINRKPRNARNWKLDLWSIHYLPKIKTNQCAKQRSPYLHWWMPSIICDCTSSSQGLASGNSPTMSMVKPGVAVSSVMQVCFLAFPILLAPSRMHVYTGPDVHSMQSLRVKSKTNCHAHLYIYIHKIIIVEKRSCIHCREKRKKAREEAGQVTAYRAEKGFTLHLYSQQLHTQVLDNMRLTWSEHDSELLFCHQEAR